MNYPSERRKPPLHTWLGFSILIVAQFLLQMDVRFVAIWLTPIMWTGYILAVDGLVFLLRGHSWLTSRRREFPFLALISVGVWVVFEAYNLHLRNWFYLGVPDYPWIRDLAYFWSFATILPGVFETIDLLAARAKIKPHTSSMRRDAQAGSASTWFVLGIAMVTIPLLVPRDIAAYLFAPVWIGYILVFDPINQRMGLPSIRRSLSKGSWRYAAIILAAGLLCGFLWESWNFQALHANGGHWIYTVPQALRIFDWHFGQMPILGLLGFPPFALELVLIYSFIRQIFDFDAWLPGASELPHPLLPRELIEN